MSISTECRLPWSEPVLLESVPSDYAEPERDVHVLCLRVPERQIVLMHHTTEEIEGELVIQAMGGHACGCWRRAVARRLYGHLVVTRGTACYEIDISKFTIVGNEVLTGRWVFWETFYSGSSTLPRDSF